MLQIREWSHYQQAIFEAFEHTQDSLLIEAVAGSGKTTVLVELARIMQRVFPRQRGCFMAFNKSIATTLQEKLSEEWCRQCGESVKAIQISREDATGELEYQTLRTLPCTHGMGFEKCQNVVAMTLHSAGWAAWRRAGGLDWQPTLDQHKVSGIIRGLMTWEERKRWEETTRKLVGFAKGVGLVPQMLRGRQYEWASSCVGLVEDSDSVWEALIEHYGLLPDECNIDWARKVLAQSIEMARETCDYDDMLAMPVIAGVPFEQYDCVLVDEAQDVSGIQMEMIARMVKVGGRVIAVGDRKQSIYGFRGAGTESMDLMRERFGMRELPLSVSYRCPRSVVEHARQWVPQIEWREDAPDGIVFLEDHDHRLQAEIALDGISKWRGIADFAPGDAILCRLNRPLIAAAFALIRARIACRVLGREIGAGLVGLVKKPKFDASRPVSDWERWAGSWFDREATKLREKRQFAAVGNLEDRLATVAVFIDELGMNVGDREATVGELIRSIEQVFQDRGPEGMVTLATCHKSKGLEFGRVFILDAGELMPVPWGRQEGWELQQERNLQYVAATRAQRELRYITSAALGIERRKR